MSLIDELKTKRQSLLDERPLQADYITAAQRTLAEMDQTIADLDKAISALTPVPSPPDESSPQASGEEGSFDAIEQEALRIARIQGMNARLRGEDSNSNPYEVFSTRSNAWSDGWHSEAPTEAERPSVVTDQDRVEQTSPPVPAVEIPEGFIPWSGGECPVDRLSKIEVILKSGHRDRHWLAGDWDGPSQDLSHWSADFGEGRIIAYKVISEPAEASEDDEPAEIISTLTGDPAIEPESGLHGEPAAEPVHHPAASFWSKVLVREDV